MRRTYFALTPCVPLSREAGEGGNLWQGEPPFTPTPLFREAGEEEPQGAPPCAPTPLFREAGEGETQGAPPFTPTPLSHPVGEGLGVRATKNTHTPHAANSSDVPLSAPSGSPCKQGEPNGYPTRDFTAQQAR